MTATPAERFMLLDGLRGIATIAVVLYHFHDRSGPAWLLPHGYLAVDFFFILSGFVLAHAYGHRLATGLPAWRFFRQRLVRLLPMLVPGTLLGAAFEIWRPGMADYTGHIEQVAAAALLGCLAIPLPVATTMERTIFPINGPVWSVFFELVANAGFVLIVRSAMPRLAALAGVILGGAIFAVCALQAGHADVGGLLLNWPGGFPRVCLSFCAGLLIFAVRDRFRAGPTLLFPAVLLAVFLLPLREGPAAACLDLGLILLLFPPLVGCAAATATRPAWNNLCRLSGDISYPLYAIHYPIVRALSVLMNRHALSTPARLGVILAAILVMTLASWMLFRFYDTPVRRFLTGRGRPWGEPSRLAAPHAPLPITTAAGA